MMTVDVAQQTMIRASEGSRLARGISVSDSALKRFRQKLRWVVRNTGDGTQQSFAKLLTEAGCPVSQTAVSRWLDDQGSWPSALFLWGITRLRDDISLDWLIGVRGADTLTEMLVLSSPLGAVRIFFRKSEKIA